MRSFGTAMRTVFESRVLMLSVSIEKQDSLNFRSFSDVSIATIAARSRGAGRHLLSWNHDIPRRGWLFSGILLGR